jgi:hypothetical protein
MTEELTIDKTDYEKRREHRLDKFLDHLNPDVNRKLGKKDQIYFDLMSKSFNWRSSFFSPEQVRKMIMNEVKDVKGKKYSYSMACQLYADMEFIFGKDPKADKSIWTKIVTEGYYKALQIVMKDNQGKEIEKGQAITNILDKIAKINKLYDTENAVPLGMIMPENVTFLIKSVTNTINFTLPPKAKSDEPTYN